MAKKKPGKASEPPALEFPVGFGDVSIGEKTARLGIVVSRGNLTVTQADRNLCGKRLSVKVMARSSGSADQPSLPGLEDDIEMDAVADVKRYGVSPKTISTGLMFMIESIDISALAKMAKREGVVTILDAEEIPAEEQGEGEE